MDFWDDASTTTKRLVAIGGALIVYFLLAMALDLPPYGDAENVGGDAVRMERGLPPR